MELCQDLSVGPRRWTQLRGDTVLSLRDSITEDAGSIPVSGMLFSLSKGAVLFPLASEGTVRHPEVPEEEDTFVLVSLMSKGTHKPAAPHQETPGAPESSLCIMKKVGEKVYCVELGVCISVSPDSVRQCLI